MIDDPQMREDGRNQQLLGKVHSLVGSVRSVKEDAVSKYHKTKNESLTVCRKHAGRIPDVASEFCKRNQKDSFEVGPCR